VPQLDADLHSSYALPSDFSSILDAVEHCTRPTRNSFTTSQGTESFGAPSFDCDGSTSYLTQAFLHLGTMWRKFGDLAHDTAVDIADVPTLSPHHRCNLLENAQRVRALPHRIGIGEMLTDVSKTRSSEKSVGTCMSDDVGIAVTDKPRCSLDANTPENECTIRIVAEPMHIETLADANVLNVLRSIHDDSDPGRVLSA
jgi:hypothetical protein